MLGQAECNAGKHITKDKPKKKKNKCKKRTKTKTDLCLLITWKNVECILTLMSEKQLDVKRKNPRHLFVGFPALSLNCSNPGAICARKEGGGGGGRVGEEYFLKE